MSRTLDGVSGPHADAPLVTGGAPAAAAEAAVVLLHGRGGTPEGMVALADEFYRPGTALLAPGARRSSWLPAGHDASLTVLEPALSSAVDCVVGAMAAAREVGVAPDNVALVGVSQGGCVLAEFLRRRPRRYGAAFVVSAALPGEDPERRPVEGDLAGTPVELAASEGDPHVPVERVRATGRLLEAGGAAVDLRIDPGDGHGLSDATSERIGARLDELLGRSDPSETV